jgi:FAD:protein FMN transferase
MGTTVNVQVIAPADQALSRPAVRSIDEAFLEIHRLERLMSTWIPESELSSVNAHAAERPVHVGPDALAVLRKSQWASEASQGAFDITFEVMHGLWRFDQDIDGKVPDAAQVADRRSAIDFRSVVLDEARSEVRFRRADTKINLGGIAKGYAIDRMARALLDGGLTDFIVQAGGDLYAHGHKPDGSPWIVGVRDPRGPEGSFFGSLAVTDHAFSTAGDYERSFVSGGKRYHHIIDPRTGYPATASRSVTVWAEDAHTADAIDDAIFILGPEQGLPLCEAVPGCGAVLVDANNKVWVSRRLEGVFQQNRPPTDGL